MPFKGRLVKQTLVHSLLIYCLPMKRNKVLINTATWTNLQRIITVKKDPKGYILYICLYSIHEMTKNTEMTEISDCQWLK
jgi:hypothetical protein